MFDTLDPGTRETITDTMLSAYRHLSAVLHDLRAMPRTDRDSRYGPGIMTQITAMRKDVMAVLLDDLPPLPRPRS